MVNPWLCEPVSVEAVLTDSQCDEALAALDPQSWRPSIVVLRSEHDPDRAIALRDAAVRSALEQSAPMTALPWLADAIIEAMLALNRRRFMFDVVGWPSSDPPIVLKYLGEQRDHFDTHRDIGAAFSTRKLSFTLQLSHPSSYRGGGVHFPTCRSLACRSRGSLTVFPAFLPHQVEAVEDGERLALVGWLHGPAFR